MKKVININDKWQIFLKVLLFISLPALSLFLCRNTEKWIMIISLVAAVICSFVLVKFIFKDIFKKIDLFYVVISFLLSDYIINVYYMYHHSFTFKGNFYVFSEWKIFILSILSVFALGIIIYYLLKKLIPVLKNFYKSLTKFEKIFLIVIFFVSLLVTTIIFNKTSVFYYGKDVYWDILYTSDSSATYINDAFFNINSIMNDFAKQPLFGIFSLPFAVIARLLSEVFFMLPNGYVIFLTVVQITAMAVAWIMLARLLKIKENSKWELCLLFLCSFTTISFALILEQYILSFFYVVLIIYSYYNMKHSVNYSFIAGVGSLVTTGILVPFVSKPCKIKRWLLNLLKCFIAGVFITVIFGQLPFIFGFVEELVRNLDSYTGVGLSFNNKLMQFLNFVKGIFIVISASASKFNMWPYQMNYALDKVNDYDIVGILILIFCFISFFINRKNKLCIISMFWILFSFVILCLVGFGTSENGLNLYSLYFSWAYIVLIYMLLYKLIRNDLVRRVIIIALIIVLLIFNISEFINIIKFGLTYYPI